MGSSYLRILAVSWLATMGSTLAGCSLLTQFPAESEEPEEPEKPDPNARYISPTGDDASSGLSRAAAWRTWSHALSQVGCGQTLVALDGSYPIATHGPLAIKTVCTPASPLHFKADSERGALILGDGSSAPLTVEASEHIVVEGLRVQSGDSDCCTGEKFHNVHVAQSKSITLKRLLVARNNRFQQSSLIRLSDTTDSLIEETELYTYHWYGLELSASDRNTVRRVYCNGRYHPDLPDHPTTYWDDRGESCTSDAGTDNIYENVISEGQGTLAHISNPGRSSGARWLGSVSLRDHYGAFFSASEAATKLPTGFLQDHVVIEPNHYGAYLRSNSGSEVRNLTAYGSASGLRADLSHSNHEALETSFSGTNVLSVSANSGFYVRAQKKWSLSHINAYGTPRPFDPAMSSNYVQQLGVDPLLGACRVWIPQDSPMKGAGVDGADIGANVLYRYIDGELTTTPLWDPVTGAFPHGAVIPGVNDIPGESLFDVHERLNVNRNGCAFPPGYGR